MSFATLGDVCARITDGTHQSPKFEKSGIPFVVIADVADGILDLTRARKWVSNSTYEECTSRCRPEGGDVLYTAVGSFGVAIPVETSKPFMFQRHIAHLKPIATKVDTRYLAYVLNSPATRRHAERVARGVAQRTITLGELKDFVIPLPELRQQVRIAAILDRADAIRRKRKQAIALTEQLLRSTFLEMFGDPVTNPKAWPVQSFGDGAVEFVDGDRGINYPKSEDYRTEGECLFLSTKNVTTRGFVFDEQTFISAEKDAQLRKGKLRREDLVITTRGTVGNIAYFDKAVPFPHIRINSGMLILRATDSRLHPRFLLELIRNFSFQKKMLGTASGSAQPQLPITLLKSLPLILPPVELQARFNACCIAIATQLKRQIVARSRTEALFTSLVHRAFTA